MDSNLLYVRRVRQADLVEAVEVTVDDEVIWRDDKRDVIVFEKKDSYTLIYRTSLDLLQVLWAKMEWVAYVERRDRGNIE